MSDALQATLRANLIKQFELERAISRALCFDSLAHFTRTFWHIIEPGNVYVHGWHIDEICKALELAAEFKLQRLIINMPPRHMKSILVSVMFPAWVWARYPERRFLCAAYSQTLSIRDGIKMRTLIESPEYQALIRPTWTLRDDQNQKTKFENTATGFRFSTSVGGTVTGEGGDFLLLDDPLNALEAESTAAREECKRWFDTVWSTRANNPKRHCKIVIMQRLHEDDLTGHILTTENDLNRYEKLVLQARYEPDSETTARARSGAKVLQFKDPRTTKGQLLWPERFDETSLSQLEADLNATALGSAQAQLQQDPRARSGGLFNREWWRYYETSPSPILETVQFIDAAQKPGITNDYSTIATWVRTQAGYFALEVWRDKVDMPTLEAITRAKAEQFKPNAIVIEDKAGGSSLIQYLVRSTTLPVIPFDPGQRDKEVRASAAAPTVQSGKCHLPSNAPWVQDFVTEHEKFPKAKHDDQVDTTSMMVEYFARRASTGGPRIRTA